jgi:hypothetical protein
MPRCSWVLSRCAVCPLYLYLALPKEATFSQENNQKLAVMELAQTYRGVGVLWEHRYYGKSLPFASVRCSHFPHNHSTV